MNSLTAAERRVQENARLIAAQTLLFRALEKSGCPIKAMGDVASTASGGTPSRSQSRFFGGSIPWIKSGDLNDGPITTVEEYLTDEGLQNSAAKVFPDKTIVVALYGATVGKTGLLTFPAASNQAVCSVIPNDSSVSSQYLFWFLRYKRAYFLNNSFGGAQPNISQGMLRDVQVPVPEHRLQCSVVNFLNSVERRQNGEDITVPELPASFSNSHELVEWIDALASRIEQSKAEADEAAKKERSLLMSAFHQISDNAPRIPLKEVAPLIRRPAFIDLTANYPGVSVRSFGRGTFHNPPLYGSEITWQKPFEVKVGDILVSNIKAWEGAIAVAGSQDDGRFGSHRYLTFVPLDGVATSRYVCTYLLSTEGLRYVGEASPGSADRNRTTSTKAMLEIPVPVPTLSQQHWFDELYLKIEAVQNLRYEIAVQRTAVLPAALNQILNGEL